MILSKTQLSQYCLLSSCFTIISNIYQSTILILLRRPKIKTSVPSSGLVSMMADILSGVRESAINENTLLNALLESDFFII